jgi:hypothetical protein
MTSDFSIAPDENRERGGAAPSPNPSSPQTKLPTYCTSRAARFTSWSDREVSPTFESANAA